MSLPKKIQGEFNYALYCAWPASERWELIDGVAFAMAPAPSLTHQRVLGQLFVAIANFLKGRNCQVFVAPFDVRLPAADEADAAVQTVVQPDISIICDASKLDERGCRGAPDWVIEIVSPSTSTHDRKTKRALYERHGVREYWLVHPAEAALSVYLLNERSYGKPEEYGDNDRVSPRDFPGLVIALDELFAQPGA